MIEDPQRLEAERLGLLGELDRARPGVGRVPAVVLALPALGHHQPDLHPASFDRAPSPRRHGAVSRGVTPSRRGRPRAPAILGRMSDVADSIPTAPLPGPPDPWASARQPCARRPAVSHDRDDRGRAGPGRGILPSLAARPARRPARRGHPRRRPAGAPILVTGCGTCEHARWPPPRSCARRCGRPGCRPRRSPAPGVRAGARAAGRGLVIGVSHEGGTAATNAALAAAARPARGRPSSPSAAARPAAPWPTSSSRPRARPELVPHDRLPVPDPGRRRPSARTCPAGPSTPARGRRSSRRRRQATAAEAIAGRLAERPAARGRLRGATGRPAASSSSRSRRRRGCRPPTATSRRSCTATCPRPTRDRPRPDPHRSRAARRARRAGRRTCCGREVLGVRAAAIVPAADAELARPHAGRPARGPGGAGLCRRRSPRCSGPPRRSSS